MEQYFDLLGRPASDKVTGFDGVITSISFDLYGCVQAVIQPEGVDEKGAMKVGHWFDVSRLRIDADAERVMDVPNYFGESRDAAVSRGEKGPADKPLP